MWSVLNEGIEGLIDLKSDRYSKKEGERERERE
jgi:hypothetical protein